MITFKKYYEVFISPVFNSFESLIKELNKDNTLTEEQQKIVRNHYFCCDTAKTNYDRLITNLECKDLLNNL